MRIHEIREHRAGKIAEARALLDTTGDSRLTEDQQKIFDALKSEIIDLETREHRALFIEEAERRSMGAPDRSEQHLESEISLLDAIACQMEQRSVTGALREYQQEHERRTGSKPAGLVVPHSLFERRAAQTTTSAAGIVPEDFRPEQFIGLLRNALVVRSLGARVLGNLRGDLRIPKQETSSTAYWINESEKLTESGLTFDTITLGPKHVGALTELSRQLLQQSNPAIEQLVRDDFAHVVAAAVDQALLSGDGVKEPEGILTAATGTGSLSTLSWAAVLKVIEDLGADNIVPNHWLTSPGVVTKLRSTLKESGLPGYLMENGQLAGTPVTQSKHMGNKAGTPDTGRAILADWSQMLVGTWGGVDVLANPYDSEAYARGGVKIRIMTTLNMVPRRPEAFAIIDDIGL